MSHYAYCGKCQQPLRSPTLADAIVSEITCSHCNEAYPLDALSRRCIIDEMVEKLERKSEVFEQMLQPKKDDEL